MRTYQTGTVSVLAGGTTVTGLGAIWSGINARETDRISIDGSPDILITAVTDTNHLEITPWAGGAKSGVPYVIYQNYPARVSGVAAAEDVGTVFAKLKTGGLPFLVEAPETVPDPSLGADGQFAIEPISGEQWLKTGGLWVSQGIFRAFGVAAPWSAVTAYQVNNVATLSGTSYICILAHTNHTPPNATYWAVLAAVGATGATGSTGAAGTNGTNGAAAWTPPAAWLTATAYVAGPPASVVTQGGETYVCLTSHTSGTFATDLAAAKWIKVAQKGTDGTGTGTVTSVTVGGTSITSSGTLPAVAYDAAQALTTAQQARGRSNIGVPGSNILINADFRINQRGYASGGSLASGYGHDRWKAGAAGGDYSFTQLASSTQITIAATKTLVQVAEDKNVVGGSYVLSWTGTAQARYAINSATPAGSYASSPILITGQTAGTVMSVEFNAGTLGTVKLESGAVVTPFVMARFQDELNAARRYFRLAFAPAFKAFTTSAGVATVEHPGMRTLPTVSATSVITISDISAANFTQSSVAVGITATRQTSDAGSYSISNFTGLTVNAFYEMYPGTGALTLDAEL